MVNPGSLEKVVGQNNIDNPNVIEKGRERERKQDGSACLVDATQPTKHSGRMRMNCIRMGMMMLLAEINSVLVEHKHANLIKNLKNSRSFNASNFLC
jgi:hypothetical protein